MGILDRFRRAFSTPAVGKSDQDFMLRLKRELDFAMPGGKGAPQLPWTDTDPVRLARHKLRRKRARLVRRKLRRARASRGQNRHSGKAA